VGDSPRQPRPGQATCSGASGAAAAMSSSPLQGVSAMPAGGLAAAAGALVVPPAAAGTTQQADKENAAANTLGARAAVAPLARSKGQCQQQAAVEDRGGCEPERPPGRSLLSLPKR
jgi:hypothetical protein